MADEVVQRLAGMGFSEADARTLAEHFLDAEARGKRGHGLSRVDWLATLPGLDPRARPALLESRPGSFRESSSVTPMLLMIVFRFPS